MVLNSPDSAPVASRIRNCAERSKSPSAVSDEIARVESPIVMSPSTATRSETKKPVMPASADIPSISTRKAIAASSIRRTKLYSLIRNGDLEAVRIGGRTLNGKCSNSAIGERFW